MEQQIHLPSKIWYKSLVANHLSQIYLLCLLKVWEYDRVCPYLKIMPCFSNFFLSFFLIRTQVLLIILLKTITSHNIEKRSKGSTSPCP